VAENEWKIAKLGAACCGCQTPLSVGQTYFSVLRNTTGAEAGEALLRQDFCCVCFQEKRPDGVFYFWKAVQQAPDDTVKKRQPVVDVEHIIEFFKRLEGETAPQRVAFRYILALMLTRKKVLVFEAKKKDSAGHELQVFREKRGGQSHAVVEPSLSEDEIANVSAELGVLLGLTPAAAPAPAAATAETTAATDQERRTSE
jgi:hypothetical protein